MKYIFEFENIIEGSGYWNHRRQNQIPGAPSDAGNFVLHDLLDACGFDCAIIVTDIFRFKNENLNLTKT